MHQTINVANNTNLESAREKIAIEVLASYDENGTINMNILKENLQSNLGIDVCHVGDELPSGNIVLNGFDFYITEKGEVINKTLFASIITSENYGDYVDYPIYYGSSDEFTTDWRIFYNDGKYVFLIASDYISNTKIPDILGIKTEGTYKMCWDELTYEGSESINEEVANKYMLQYFISNKYSMKAVASLMDTDNWKTFVDNNLADSSIGSPTIEMFCESWNQKGYIKLYYNNYDSKGYFIGENDNPTTIKYDISSDTGYFDTLYYPHQDLAQDECYGYWLSSPAATDSGYLMRVSSVGNINYRHYNIACEGLRPIVCLKFSITGTQDENGIWILSN